jgi:hypothetical protein
MLCAVQEGDDVDREHGLAERHERPVSGEPPLDPPFPGVAGQIGFLEDSEIGVEVESFGG